MIKKVILKKGREKSVLQRHPWIFSGAIESLPSFENGELLSVYDSQNHFLAKAHFHKTNSISGRILTFEDELGLQAIFKALERAISFRKDLFDQEKTNAYRLVNAEGDGLSGLIIDIYGTVAVIQITTHGMEKEKGEIVAFLVKALSLSAVFEKSSSAAREQEGLQESIQLLYGQCPDKIEIRENGITFLVDLQKGQKTGFFLDQREMRQLVEKISCGKTVLNCFAYSGAFSLFALRGGAYKAISVDKSASACRLALENTHLNPGSQEKHELVCQDVFTYLKEAPFSDFIILDPPAFAKKRGDVNQACRGYKEINRQALQKLPPSGYLLTCSCSHFIDEELFLQLLFQSALEAKREVQICSSHIQALDHPTSLYHPEGRYLKSLLLRVVS